MPDSTLSPGMSPLSYVNIVNDIGLEILRGGGDLVVENGDLALTKDGDLKLGDAAHNSLFRLVQAWRLNAPHLQFLFEQVAAMKSRRVEISAQRDRWPSDWRDPLQVEAFHSLRDQQAAAEYGFRTYAGCLILVISGALLRFQNDIGVGGDAWKKVAPLFNGCSCGQIIVAAANGYRHEDEWAKTRTPTAQQKASQDVLDTVLPIGSASGRIAPGRCPEVLDLLSRGGAFDSLTRNVLTFAHNVAVNSRKASSKPNSSLKESDGGA